VASDLDQAERPLATEKADAAQSRLPHVLPGKETLTLQREKRSKEINCCRDTLHDVPVNIPDGTQRRIDVRPTSLQDVYYYPLAISR
jgi:hypothetical protein